MRRNHLKKQGRPPVYYGESFRQPHPHSYKAPNKQNNNNKKIFSVFDPPTLFHAGSLYDNDQKKGYVVADENNVSS